MLGPSIALGLAIRRARVVAAQVELDRIGRNVLIALASLLALTLGLGGLYAIARYVQSVR